ncbi:MAG: ammonium transporter, partial [Sulfolobales archaeon]|nr:ammonium transporter [Sulfolobales archaeon]
MTEEDRLWEKGSIRPAIILSLAILVIVFSQLSSAQTTSNTTAEIQSLNQSILALENRTAYYPSAAVPSWL